MPKIRLGQACTTKFKLLLSKCLFCGMEQYWQCALNKIDIIWNKKNMMDQSNILCSRQPFFINELSTKFYINSDSWRNKSKFLKARYTKNVKIQGMFGQYREKQLPFPPWILVLLKHKSFFFILSNEKWLSLTKYFWKIYHYSQYLVQHYRSFFFFFS